MDKIPRLNFINSISGFKSANLLGTKDKTGQTNLAIFSSVVHLGSKPPLFGFITRPTTVERHTYANIKETKAFTINHVSSKMAKRAHQTSANYSKTISEFEACGFEAEELNNFYAPFVKESKIKLALTFEEEHNINANGTILVVGKLEFVEVANELPKNGLYNIEQNDTVAISGLSRYHKTKQFEEFEYARP